MVPRATGPIARTRADRRGVDYPFHLLRAGDQALEDLAASGATQVVLLQHAREGDAREHFDALTERALGAGFAVASLPLEADAVFDTLEGVVRAIGRRLRAPGVPRAKTGFSAMLEAFCARHGAGASRALEAGLEREAVRGELAELARRFVASGPARSPAATARRTPGARELDAWLSGVELARAEQRAGPAEPRGLPALSARTAKRALADATRLVRAVEHRGTLLIVTGAEIVPLLPPARREAAYTVLRELVDNADGGHGMVSTRLVVAGSTSFFQGARALSSLPPLHSRLSAVREEHPGPAPPLAAVVQLGAPEAWARAPLPALRVPHASGLPQLRALIRVAQGLPPLEPEVALSVGVERIDRSIDALFAHASVDASVFALLVGEYGAGKTHYLLHLATRALAARRPVLRLSLERLDADLGHPERHLARMLESGLLPPRALGGPLHRAARWTGTPEGVSLLRDALGALALEGDELVRAGATKALEWASGAPRPGAALETWLRATDLTEKRPGPRARLEAYQRLLVWLALLERLEGVAGPVLLIDEAENLYRGGISRAERRTALRALAFYCGGLPRACVVLAVTPDALAELRSEAPELLSEVDEQRTALDVEDATMLCRRLRAARPIAVPKLEHADRLSLLRRVQAAHEAARGPRREGPGDEPFAALAARLVSEPSTPRELLRRAVHALERKWWEEPAATPEP